MFPIAAFASLEVLFLAVCSCLIVWYYNCIFMTDLIKPQQIHLPSDNYLVGYQLKTSFFNTSSFTPTVRWHQVGLAVGTSAGARNKIRIRKI